MTIDSLHPDELVELSFHAKDPKDRDRALRLLERQGSRCVDRDGRPIPGYQPDDSGDAARRSANPGYYRFVNSLM